MLAGLLVLCGLFMIEAPGSAQERVDPENLYARSIPVYTARYRFSCNLTHRGRPLWSAICTRQRLNGEEFLFVLHPQSGRIVGVYRFCGLGPSTVCVLPLWEDKRGILSLPPAMRGEQSHGAVATDSR